MKKHHVFIMVSIALMLIAASFFFSAVAEEHIFNLPEALRIIDTEAFRGTNAEEIRIGDNLLEIHSEAFADMTMLRDVHIPKSTRFIAEKIFGDRKNIAIHGYAGSYAHRWAVRHRYRFVFQDLFLADESAERRGQYLERTGPVYFYDDDILDDRLLVHENAQVIRIMKPQEREELHDIDYRFP